MNTPQSLTNKDLDRRRFLSMVGKGVGLAALTTASIASLMENVRAATKRIEHLLPEQAAMDEDFWFEIQQAFSVTRGIINLNNGGVSPSPRIVTEAVARYLWEQEDATAYTMWSILEPQSETVRAGLADVFGCDKEEIAITRNASESLEIDEVLSSRTGSRDRRSAPVSLREPAVEANANKSEPESITSTKVSSGDGARATRPQIGRASCRERV